MLPANTVPLAFCGRMPFVTFYGPFWDKRDQTEQWLLTMGQSCWTFANMAKQAGNVRITGTIDEFCFYKMDGVYYVRMKSRLTGKRFWKDEAFEGSRRSCNRFAEGNKIASKVYRMVAEEDRVYKLFCFLKKTAIALLKDGIIGEEVQKVLVEYLKDFGLVRGKVKAKKHKEGVRGDCCQIIDEANFIWPEMGVVRNIVEFLPVFPFEFLTKRRV